MNIAAQPMIQSIPEDTPKMKKLLLILALLCVPAWAVPVTPITNPHVTYVDASGLPCAGCSLYTYAAGTTTPLATYTDAAGTVQNTNPIILDAAGGATIWPGSNSYKFVLESPLGATIWTVDQVTSYVGKYLPFSGGTLTGPLTGTTITANVNGVINAGNYATFDLALAACPGSGTCVIQFPAGTWTTTYIGSPCVARSNLTLLGAGMPNFDSATAPTKLVGGTIIEPGIDFCGASNVTVMNMGFDDGSAYVGGGGAVANGLMFEGTSNGSNPADPTVQNINVVNVANLGSSNVASVHAFIVEHASGVFLSNINSANDTHCNVIKSSNVVGFGITGRACFTNVLIIKTDTYTPNQGNITLSGVQGYTLNSGDTTNGINIDAEAGQIGAVNISDVIMNGVRDPINFNNISSFGLGAIDGVKISSAQLTISNLSSGSAGCVTSTGAGGGLLQIGLEHIDCTNGTALAVAPLQIYNGWFNSSITDWKSMNAGYTSTLTGAFTLSGWQDLGTSAPLITTFTAAGSGNNFVVSNWQTARGNSEAAPSGGATIQTDTTSLASSLASPPAIGGTVANAATFTSLIATGGAAQCSSSVSVSALNTLTLATATAFSGLLHVRDNTNGGSALFIADPNGGVTLLANQGITGMGASGDVAWSSGWEFQLTSGSVPRTLQWCFLQ